MRQYGFFLLFTGFCVTAIFMLLYVTCIYKNLNIDLRNFAFEATFIGLGVAAIGRIGVFLENRAQKKEWLSDDKKDKA